MNPDQSEQKPISIGIMGTPLTSGNRGVLALGSALTRLCLDAGAKGGVRLFGSHPCAGMFVMRPHGHPTEIPIVHWRMSPRSNPRNHLFVIVGLACLYRFVPVMSLRRRIVTLLPWIAALQNTTFVGDVRGGDSFSDIYGIKRFLVATLPVLSVIWVKGDIVLFPQTYGPFKSLTARWIARWIVRHSSTVIARDRESQRIAQNLAGNGKNVLLSPDVAFALHADTMNSVQLDNSLVPEAIPEGTIGLNVNGLMFNGGYTGKNMFGLKLDYQSFLKGMVKQLLEVHPGTLLLIPHTYAPRGDVESDNDACIRLKENLPPELQPRVRVVTGDYDAHQLKGIIARCEFFVGSRMHSCIAALSQGVPCVGVAYSMKFRGVFESVDMRDWVVDGRSNDNDAAIRAVMALYHQRGAKQEGLRNEAQAARQRLGEIFSAMVNTQRTLSTS